MRKIIIYAAVSLNGKIARKNGEVDWLDTIPNPNNTDYGYYEFYDSIDTTIQGYSTYDQVIHMGVDFPYKDKQNFVLTRKTNLLLDPNVEFITENHIDKIKAIKSEAGKDIWLIGGGQINTLLLNNKLVEEVILHVMPIIIPDGIALFEGIPNEVMLSLNDVKKYESGVVEMKYAVQYQ
jgi:dihydrofolate reductase